MIGEAQYGKDNFPLYTNFFRIYIANQSSSSASVLKRQIAKNVLVCIGDAFVTLLILNTKAYVFNLRI